jgi:hypothetical protein
MSDEKEKRISDAEEFLTVEGRLRQAHFYKLGEKEATLLNTPSSW